MEAGPSRPVNTNCGNLTTNRAMGHEISISTRLLGAAVAGDWTVAEEILQNNPVLATARLTPSGETALHVAAAAAEAKHEYFVNKFLEKLPDHDLTIKNQAGSTALHLAALAGNEKIAELMVRKNTILPTISNNQHVRPIFLAAMSGNGEMVEYLLQYSNFGSLDDVDRSKILNTCIDAGLYGVAREIVEQYTILAVTKDQNGEAPLDVLARKRSAFSSRSQTGGWWRTIYALCCKKVARGERPAKPDDVFELLELIWKQVPPQDIENPNIPEDIARPTFVAAKLGNYEFLVELLRQRPEFLYIVNSSHQSIFHIAVKHRYVFIFSLIREIGELKNLVASYRDDQDNTMLHLAADNVPESQLNILPGAALQMHRELLWYKEVKKIVPKTYRNIRNKTDNKTPHELFIEKHKGLMEEGEKWMKKTAQSCMVVSTLITTVVFTTAFTVPGGNDNQTGEPLLRHHGFFLLFAIAETIAMLSSITSISMFLCILTSRYTEKDFLESLPYWLVGGIVTLLISLAGMMVAFCACFLLYDRHSSAKVPILLGVFGCMPMMLAILEYPLLADIIGSIHAAKRLFRSRQRLTSKDYGKKFVADDVGCTQVSSFG